MLRLNIIQCRLYYWYSCAVHFLCPFQIECQGWPVFIAYYGDFMCSDRGASVKVRRRVIGLRALQPFWHRATRNVSTLFRFNLCPHNPHMKLVFEQTTR